MAQRQHSAAAAVLVPVYRGADGALRIVLIERSQFGPHGGQIAFPGGKPEPGDADLATTALRETTEEIGLMAPAVTLLATLPAVETRLTRFLIQPFLARIEPPMQWCPDGLEIVAVLEVGLDDLTRPGTECRRDLTAPDGRRLSAVPCFDVAPQPIWGATYRILTALLPRLDRGEFDDKIG